MYVSSSLNLLLKSLDRNLFNKLVKQYNGAHHKHKFTPWNHLVTLIASQLNGCSSLREIEIFLNSKDQHHYHHSLKSPVRRSTISDANNKRDYRIFEDLAISLMSQANKKIKKETQEMISLIDASPIQLKGAKIHSWCKKGGKVTGLKLHSEYDLYKALPVRCSVTDAKVDDRTPMQDWPLSPERIYIFDRGYMDYNFWHKIFSIESSFVTRLHKASKVRVISEEALSQEEIEAGILSSRIVKMGNKSIARLGKRRQNKIYDKTLRLVRVERKEDGKILDLLTNNLSFTPCKISKLYKSRWYIETHFKWLKQSLNIKKFIGNSENATKIQLYVAIITYILLSLLRDTLNLGKESLKTLLHVTKSLLFAPPAMILRYFKPLKPDKKQRKVKQNIQLNLWEEDM